MCVTDETLKTYIDRELGQGEQAVVAAHLAACDGCRARHDKMLAQAERVREALGKLSPTPSEAPLDARIAWARFQERAEVLAATPSGWARVFARRWRPVWAGAAAAMLVIASLSFAPARSLAQRILAMLRVQRIEFVSLDPAFLAGPDMMNGSSEAAKRIGQLLSDQLVVTVPPAPPVRAADAAQASQLAGFHVRLFGARDDAPTLRVQGEQAFHMTLDRERLQDILDETGRSDVQLPASIDGATVAVRIPKGVLSQYGPCPKFVRGTVHGKDGTISEPGQQANEETGDSSPCVILLQIPSPTVSVPPDLNIAELAEAALEVGGMSPDQAQAFSQSVDWTSTLVLPLPRVVGSTEKTEVDGVEGTLISSPAHRRRPAGYALVWVKDGIIYSVMGTGNSARGFELADSLQ